MYNFQNFYKGQNFFLSFLIEEFFYFYCICTSSNILKTKSLSSESNNTIQTEKVLADIEVSQTNSAVNNREIEIKGKIDKYGKNTTEELSLFVDGKLDLPAIWSL